VDRLAENAGSGRKEWRGRIVLGLSGVLRSGMDCHRVTGDHD
jgi:hypothetical protein